jgi:hypothetical protein
VTRVAKVADLESIVLKTVHGERADEVKDASLTAKNDMKVGHLIRDRALFVTVWFTYRTEPNAFSIDATMNLQYKLSEERTAEDAEAFAQINAVFNAWPYWREIVQSTATRMGILIPPIPLLKIPALQPSPEADAHDMDAESRS